MDSLDRIVETHFNSDFYRDVLLEYSIINPEIYTKTKKMLDAALLLNDKKCLELAEQNLVQYRNYMSEEVYFCFSNIYLNIKDSVYKALSEKPPNGR
jgi:hypothetical protein